MNLTSLQNTPTMSSREIAELCDKEHRNVLADIRTMCEQLNLDVLTFQHIYLDSMNRISEYDFTVNQDYVRFTENSEKPQDGTISLKIKIISRSIKL